MSDDKEESIEEVRNATAEELEDPKYWEDVYDEEDTPGFDLGEPAPEFVWFSENAQPAFKPGKAIVLGCGPGNDAVFLAQKGFEVTAVDYARHAIEQTQDNAKAAGVELVAHKADLFSLVPEFESRFDYVIEHTCYCAIHPTRRKDYARLAGDLLNESGQLVGLFYNHQREGGPPYDTTPDDVRTNFEPYFDCRTLAFAQHGVERRLGKELFARFYKR